jgi:two-component sensor histidine kinase
MDIEDINVSIDTAIPCGLLVDELVSNALKHAFRTGRRGTIAIALSLDSDGAISLKVCDNGIGVLDIAEIERRMKMGSRTIMGLGEKQLSGRISFSSGPGLACELRFANQRYAPRI